MIKLYLIVLLCLSSIFGQINQPYPPVNLVSLPTAGTLPRGYFAFENIFTNDPFASIDIEAVGKLVEIATKEGLKGNKKLKIGICGEHGGDPESIKFFEKIKLDYVSCSPYRIPIARLSAAQASIEQG